MGARAGGAAAGAAADEERSSRGRPAAAAAAEAEAEAEVLQREKSCLDLKIDSLLFWIAPQDELKAMASCSACSWSEVPHAPPYVSWIGHKTKFRGRSLVAGAALRNFACRSLIPIMVHHIRRGGR